MSGFDDLFIDALSNKMKEAVEVECSMCGCKMLAMPSGNDEHLCWECEENQI